MNIITEASGRRYRILTHILQLVGQTNVVDFQASQGLTKDGKFGLLS